MFHHICFHAFNYCCKHCNCVLPSLFWYMLNMLILEVTCFLQNFATLLMLSFSAPSTKKKCFHYFHCMLQ